MSVKRKVKREREREKEWKRKNLHWSHTVQVMMSKLQQLTIRRETEDRKRFNAHDKRMIAHGSREKERVKKRTSSVRRKHGEK